MLDTHTQLQLTLGLTATEATIYVAALPYPTVGVNDVVKLTGIKRTTVYHAIDTLLSKGLANKKIAGGKLAFGMISPQFLQHGLSAQIKQIEAKKNDLEKILPDLKLLQKSPVFSTQVQHFEGIAGVKAVYEEALYCRSRHWESITPTVSFLEQYGKNFHDYVAAKKRERHLHDRALWEEVKKNKKRVAAESPGTREVRVMPKSMQGQFRSKTILFDKQVALIMPASDAGAVLIKSEELYLVFHTIFATIWEISERACLSLSPPWFGTDVRGGG